jgi:hypothetical protein
LENPFNDKSAKAMSDDRTSFNVVGLERFSDLPGDIINHGANERLPWN